MGYDICKGYERSKITVSASKEEVLGAIGVSNYRINRVGVTRGIQGKKSEDIRGGKGGKGRMKTFAEAVFSGGVSESSDVQVDVVDDKVVKEVQRMIFGGSRNVSLVFLRDLIKFQKLTSDWYLGASGYFQSTYIEDKLILWRFEFDKDCAGFITNRFLWEDSFSSMEKWSSSVVVKSRLTWINFFGTPLCHWNSEFFLQMGKEFGEPLRIDDDALFKKRLFKERVLVLINLGVSCPKYINIKVGNEAFRLRVEEQNFPVEVQWVERFLELEVRKTKRWEKGNGCSAIGQQFYSANDDVTREKDVNTRT
ncbi:hypothetical protein Q3G72_030702 [Acer saccharum]|nr:hypothetical protein Q3G72_030702 [Acer saccharum]